MNNKALVIFSGGQDSTTCLGWALKHYDEVECISFFYGQKHSVELEQSKKICELLNVKQTIVDISFLDTLVDSALTSNGDVNKSHPRLQHLPASFVPNRNQLFITLSHGFAQKIGASVLVTGVCETDFSGYPDCRNNFIKSIENATNMGAFGEEAIEEHGIKIVTPLMYIDKAETFQLAKDVDILDTVINMSHSCYNGDHDTFNEWGYGCGECPACKLRKAGYEKFINV